MTHTFDTIVFLLNGFSLGIISGCLYFASCVWIGTWIGKIKRKN